MRPLVLLILLVGSASAGAAQTTAPTGIAVPGALTVERTDGSRTVSFFNRDVAILRARVAGRSPDERAAGAVRILEGLADDRLTGPIEIRPIGGGTLILVASRGVLVLTDADVDELAGETLGGVAAQTAAHLRQALAEAAEARAPRLLVEAALRALAVVALACVLLWAFARARRRLGRRLSVVAEDTFARAIGADMLQAARVHDLQRYTMTVALTAVDVVIGYATTSFVLRQFPYTRPWGESMRGFLVSTIETLALNAAHALPGLVTIAIIVVLTRFLVRVASVWFRAVEGGRASAPWIYPDTAQPTRRIVTVGAWAFAAIVAYPYMPGSQTEAFKGVTVFFGLMLTLGSSGLVNQIMSGLMVTYSRALRIGDFVRIGDVEGTVEHLGLLSTRVRTLQQEEVTIPNAVVVSQTMTDYSRRGDVEGVFTTTSVTIGYDAPWRQIHAMLLLAAARTPGLRAEPKPVVRQAGLEDFYVKYTLWVCLERQQERPHVLDHLHANIQDLFNEYGVQIMSPNYMIDPAMPKVVPKEQWFAAPADVASAHVGAAQDSRR